MYPVAFQSPEVRSFHQNLVLTDHCFRGGTFLRWHTCPLCCCGPIFHWRCRWCSIRRSLSRSSYLGNWLHLTRWRFRRCRVQKMSKFWSHRSFPWFNQEVYCFIFPDLAWSKTKDSFVKIFERIIVHLLLGLCEEWSLFMPGISSISSFEFNLFDSTLIQSSIQQDSLDGQRLGYANDPRASEKHWTKEWRDLASAHVEFPSSDCGLSELCLTFWFTLGSYWGWRGHSKS